MVDKSKIYGLWTQGIITMSKMKEMKRKRYERKYV